MRKFYECKECECNCRVSFVTNQKRSDALVLYMLSRCSIADFQEYTTEVLSTKVDYVQPYRVNWPFILYLVFLLCVFLYIVDYLCK